MSLQTISEWLRCPNCFLPLDPTDVLTIGCPAGHSFDINKRGYASLLRGPHKFIGDSPAMLDARDSFQSGGFYALLQHTISHRVALERPHRIIDIGCGSGYYLIDALREAATTTPDWTPRGLAVDLSPAAVARTVRADSRIDGLVADVWSSLAVRDDVADVIMNVFAPRNISEFHRVLAPGGLLLVVVPQENHLQELRATGLALCMQPDKARHLIESAATHFTLEDHQSLSVNLSLTAAAVDAVLGMGPSAHHTGAEGHLLGEVTTSVTAAFDIFSFRPISQVSAF